MLSLYQFILLFNSIGHIIPVRYLLGSFMCIQFFIGPVLAYNGLDAYQYFMYTMRVPQEQYFSYAIPAVVLFILGLHVNAGKLKGEFLDRPAIERYVQRFPKLPYFFIGLGLFSSVLSSFFNSDFAFVFYILGSFKFIGLFLIILGNRKLKVWPMVFVIGSIISSSLGQGMFHDLITWAIFSISVFALRFKFNFRVKLIGLLGFVIIVMGIQIFKGSYRLSIKNNKNAADLEKISKLQYDTDKSGVLGLVNFKTLASSNVRINQGFIITNIMVTVPQKIPFENGKEMMKILEAGIMPRILAPNKLRAGDRPTFIKYTGIRIDEGTSMGISSLGDAYINFAELGGCIFMFVLGFLYSEILNLFYRQSSTYPILILFTSLVFYYPIRPDCELQTILGHLFKSTFLIIIMIKLWKYNFAMPAIFDKKEFSGSDNPA